MGGREGGREGGRRKWSLSRGGQVAAEVFDRASGSPSLTCGGCFLSGRRRRSRKVKPTASRMARRDASSPAGSTFVASRSPTNLREGRRGRGRGPSRGVQRRPGCAGGPREQLHGDVGFVMEGPRLLSSVGALRSLRHSSSPGEGPLGSWPAEGSPILPAGGFQIPKKENAVFFRKAPAAIHPAVSTSRLCPGAFGGCIGVASAGEKEGGKRRDAMPLSAPDLSRTRPCLWTVSGPKQQQQFRS